MRNSGNVVFGGILVAIGALWLFKSLGLFSFYWSDIFNLWYWFLIAAGVSLLLSGISNNRLAGSLAGVFLTLAIVGGVVRGAHREFRNLSPFEWQSKKSNDWGNDRRERRNRRERKQDNNRQEALSGTFGYDIQPGMKSSKLNFSGGAGVFVIDSSTSRLFEANTTSSFANYVSNIRHGENGDLATIDFKMDDDNIDLDGSTGENAVSMWLNDTVSWSLHLKLGAGKADFDLSKNNIGKLEMNAGAADVKIKLGDKAPQSDVSIKAGVASVQIAVPKTAAVEIISKGALNSTNFEGFTQTGKDQYRSPDFDEKQNKIKINYRGGMSSLKIERY